jgi:hypothetical protein
MDITGEVYGKLLVLERSSSPSKVPCWECLCDCGLIKSVRQTHLRSGHTNSCGCLQRERLSEATRQHGYYGTPTYGSWFAMKQRCNNPNNNRYIYYGALGVTVDTNWNTFINFHNDMGDRPMGKTLDRIDPTGDYTKDNCRWATSVEQRNNRRMNLGEKY